MKYWSKNKSSFNVKANQVILLLERIEDNKKSSHLLQFGFFPGFLDFVS